MDYFSRGFKSVLGGQEDGKEGPSGAETVRSLQNFCVSQNSIYNNVAYEYKLQCLICGYLTEYHSDYFVLLRVCIIWYEQQYYSYELLFSSIFL